MNDFVPLLKTALLLVASNTFMTFAWYGHLKYLHNKGLPLVILISWGIAFFEYCFQVPANRTGAAFLNGYQLKILQEVITLIVFVVFAKVVLGESIRWNHLVSFGCLAAAAWFAFAYNSPNQPLWASYETRSSIGQTKANSLKQCFSLPELESPGWTFMFFKIKHFYIENIKSAIYIFIFLV